MLDFVCERNIGFLVSRVFCLFCFFSCTIYCFYDLVGMYFSLMSDLFNFYKYTVSYVSI